MSAGKKTQHQPVWVFKTIIQRHNGLSTYFLCDSTNIYFVYRVDCLSYTFKFETGQKDKPVENGKSSLKEQAVYISLPAHMEYIPKLKNKYLYICILYACTVYMYIYVYMHAVYICMYICIYTLCMIYVYVYTVYIW